MISAPSGMATPSEIKSINSSQQLPRSRPVDWKGTQRPLAPKPSAATTAASAKSTRQMTATTVFRFGSLPLAIRRSMTKVTSTSVRAMAEVMAANTTNKKNRMPKIGPKGPMELKTS